LLQVLDKRAKENQTFHYWRSLLSIYQLDDMIMLDVPWWTYSAIDAIETFIKTLPHKALVFEYGSGASTIWLAKRAEQVISVEHDKLWFNKLENEANRYSNITLIWREPQQSLDHNYASKKLSSVNFKSYVRSIHEFQTHYDLIIIDGRSREACLKECLPFLKPNGIIVFDNSNRKRYQAILQNENVVVQRFYGRVPGSPFKSETAILKLK
jgi:hypothetical protein